MAPSTLPVRPSSSRLSSRHTPAGTSSISGRLSRCLFLANKYTPGSARPFHSSFSSSSPPHSLPRRSRRPWPSPALFFLPRHILHRRSIITTVTMPRPAWLALWLASSLSPALAQTAGTYAQVGNTQVSAMMVCTMLLVRATLHSVSTDVPWKHRESLYS